MDSLRQHLDATQWETPSKSPKGKVKLRWMGGHYEPVDAANQNLVKTRLKRVLLATDVDILNHDYDIEIENDERVFKGRKPVSFRDNHGNLEVIRPIPVPEDVEKVMMKPGVMYADAMKALWKLGYTPFIGKMDDRSVLDTLFTP